MIFLDCNSGSGRAKTKPRPAWASGRAACEQGWCSQAAEATLPVGTSSPPCGTWGGRPASTLAMAVRRS